MSKLLSFEDFASGMDKVKESGAASIKKQVFGAVSNRILTESLTSDYLTEDEKMWLENFMINHKLKLDPSKLDESIWHVLKKGYEKVKDSEFGKNVVSKLGNVMDHAKTFANYIADLFKKAWDKLLGFYKTKYAKTFQPVVDEIKKKTGDEAKRLKDNLKKELKDLRTTMSWWLKDFPKIMVDTIRGKFSKEIVEECLRYDGQMLNEMKQFTPQKARAYMLREQHDEDKKEDKEDVAPAHTDGGDSKDISHDGKQHGIFGFLNKMAEKLNKFFPFSVLNKIKEVGEAGAKKILTEFSVLTKKMGGPGVFGFVILSALAGAIFEHFVKKQLMVGVEDVMNSEFVLRFIPGATSLLQIIEMVGLFAGLIEMVAIAIEGEQEVAHEGEEKKQQANNAPKAQAPPAPAPATAP